MKRYIFILLFILVAAFNSMAQTSSQEPAVTTEEDSETDSVSTIAPVQIVASKFGASFYQNGERISTSLLREVVVKNPKAVKEMEIARKNYLASVGFNTAGSFLVGYSLASAVLGGTPSWKIIGAGGILLGAGIPFTKAYLKHATHAVEFHNKSLSQAGTAKPELQFGLGGSGVGLKLTF